MRVSFAPLVTGDTWLHVSVTLVLRAGGAMPSCWADSPGTPSPSAVW